MPAQRRGQNGERDTQGRSGHAPSDRVVLIEDTRGYWRTNVFTLLEQRGYTAFARSRHNVALRRA